MHHKASKTGMQAWVDLQHATQTPSTVPVEGDEEPDGLSLALSNLVDISFPRTSSGVTALPDPESLFDPSNWPSDTQITQLGTPD